MLLPCEQARLIYRGQFLFHLAGYNRCRKWIAAAPAPSCMCRKLSIRLPTTLQLYARIRAIWLFDGVSGADVNEAREGQSYNLACIVPMAPSSLLAHHGIEA